MNRTFRSLRLAAVAAAIAGMGAAHALTAPQVLEAIARAGFHAPYDVQKTHGVWTAKGTSAQGEQRYLLVDDAKGQLNAIARTDLGTQLPGAQQVAAQLRRLGWALVEDVEFDDGLWSAEVRRWNGDAKVEVVVHPVTLQVLAQTATTGTNVGANTGAATGTNAGANTAYGTGTGVTARYLSAQQIVQALQNAGYRYITDVEFDDGRWEAEATNAAGQRVELRINPSTGVVEREKLDR